MKKTFPVNINGSIFYIDEDAYQLLNVYLEQLRSAFPGDEGKEIVADIEARIAEIFNEIIENGARVISIADINNVIEQMGRPAELGDTAGCRDAEGNSFENNSPSTEEDTTPPPFSVPETRKRLYRDENNKVFGGVLSGLACYAGWTTNVLRLLVVLIWFIFLCSAWPLSWSLIILYLLAWMIIPPARTAQQYLEMTGTPVTVSNVGQTILDAAAPSNRTDSGSFLRSSLTIIGKAVVIIFGLVASGCVIGCLTLLIASICGLILYSGWGNVDFLRGMDIFSIYHPILSTVGSICLSLALIIPSIAVIWGVCCVLFKVRSASKTIIISAIVLEIILIVATIILLALSGMRHHEFCMIGCDMTQPIWGITSSLAFLQA